MSGNDAIPKVTLCDFSFTPFNASLCNLGKLVSQLFKVIAHKPVSDHPGRSEPQVRKRRPKAYPLMTKPRHELRKQLQSA